MPPARHTRRRYLHLAGSAAVTGIAGCTNRQPESEPRDTDPGTEPRGTDPPATDLVLRAVSERTLDDGGVQVVVFPRPLQGWLVRAATEDVVIRKRAQAYSGEQFIPPDQLPLTRPEHAILDSDGTRDDLSDQPFGLDVKTGLGKWAAFRAEGMDTQPANRTVIEIDDLPAEKRALALELINEEFVTLRPEAELAEWLRTEVLDAYLRHEGQHYDVSILVETDDGFVEGIVYFIIDLTRASPSEADTPLTLRLSGDDSGVRPFVEAALENREGEVARYSTQRLPEDVIRFAEDTEFLMTYADLYRVSVE